MRNQLASSSHSNRIRRGALLPLWAAALFCAGTAAAQSGSEMGQGEASIAVRSDVKLGIKGTGGTSSARLAKLGEAISDQMGEIRKCYHKQVAASPEVIGALRLRVALPDKSDKPEVALVNESGGAKELVACVTRAIGAGKYRDLGRPAAALISLEFDNSRARGEAEMSERKAEIAHVDAHATADGKREAAWSTDGSEVRFTVRADDVNAVELVLRGFESGFAAFLDCRRKCEQGGASPEGDIEADLHIDRRSKLRLALGAISVQHQRARGCSERAFKRVRFDRPDAALDAHVTVHFAP